MRRLRYFYVLIFILLECLTNVTSKKICQLDSHKINDNYLYLKLNDSGKYEFLRRNYLKSGEKLHLFCKTPDISVEIICKSDGTFNPPLPYETPCTTRLTSRVVPRTSEHCDRLGGKFFGIGYQVGDDFVDVYQSCYNTTNVQALYSTHTIGNLKIQATEFKRPSSFSTDGYLKRSDESSFDALKIYERFKEILGTNQNYIRNGTVSARQIIRGHLAPSADFMTVCEKMATFKYVNVVPQLQKPNNKNWKRLEMWSRNLIKNDEISEILTGAIGVLELNSMNDSCSLKKIHLLKNRRNPVPKWMVKVIKHSNDRYVIALNNNQFVGQYNNIEPEPLCEKIECPNTLIFNDDPYNSGIAFCCDVDKFKKQYPSYSYIL